MLSGSLKTLNLEIRDKKMTIHKLLIVDDSNVIRNKIERDIQDGHLGNLSVVGKAKDGKEALYLFRQHQPDFVTMDLTMPNIDGLACIRSMIAINSNINILVISALADEHSGLLALQYGARGFLQKPFTDYELQQAVKEMMVQPIVQ